MSGTSMVAEAGPKPKRTPHKPKSKSDVSDDGLDDADDAPSGRTYEVGMAYRDGKYLWLAIDEDVLVRHDGQKAKEVRPAKHKQRNYEVVRGLNFDELCKRWGITAEQMDRDITCAYLRPMDIDPREVQTKMLDPKKSRPSLKGSGRRRKNGGESAETWRELRTVKRLTF